MNHSNVRASNSIKMNVNKLIELAKYDQEILTAFPLIVANDTLWNRKLLARSSCNLSIVDFSMALDVSNVTGWKMKRRSNTAYLAFFIT